MSDIQTRVHYDPDGRMIFERVQDVQPILDANKEMQTHGTIKTPWGRKIASVPCVLLEKWMHEEGLNFLQATGPEFTHMVRRKLNDPDYRWLKTITASV